MQDSWGDGWNGASLDVDINGVPATSFGFTNGNNSTDSVFTLNGDIVEFNFVSGNWDTETTYQIYDPLSNQIGSYGPYPNNQGNSGPVTSDTSNSTCAPQFVNVTFQVDMNGVEVNSNGVFVAGSFQGWNPSLTQLTDDGDNIYSVTIEVDAYSTHEYKFLNGNYWGADEGVWADCGAGNGNRTITVGDISESDVQFNLIQEYLNNNHHLKKKTYKNAKDAAKWLK